MPSTSAEANIAELSQPNNSLIQKGKTLYNTNCASCHGTNGKGDGVAAAALKPSPRNFTSKDGWVNGPKLTEIYKTLSEGIKGSAMVAFDNFTPDQKFALAEYIRSAFVPDPPKDSKEDLENLVQTYGLNTGQKNPGQIPIPDAMVLLERNANTESQQLMNLLNTIKEDANNSESNNGARLFNSITNNKLRALTVLANTDEWHNNETVFIDLIVHELNEDGFNDKIHDLTNEQWDSLFKYMNKIFS